MIYVFKMLCTWKKIVAFIKLSVNSWRKKLLLYKKNDILRKEECPNIWSSPLFCFYVHKDTRPSVARLAVIFLLFLSIQVGEYCYNCADYSCYASNDCNYSVENHNCSSLCQISAYADWVREKTACSGIPIYVLTADRAKNSIRERKS